MSAVGQEQVTRPSPLTEKKKKGFSHFSLLLRVNEACLTHSTSKNSKQHLHRTARDGVQLKALFVVRNEGVVSKHRVAAHDEETHRLPQTH